MNAIPNRLALALIASLMTHGALAATTAATVNGVAISSDKVEAFATQQKAQGKPDSEQLRKAILDRLIQLEVLSQEAKKKGLEKQAAVATQIDIAKQTILANAYLQDFAKAHPVSDSDVKQEYDRFKTSLGDKEYKVRHILVDKEEDAKAIIGKLQNGQKFEDLAKESTDPGSKDKGGDLGWTSPVRFVKPFGEAMVKLEKGKFTPQPVKTDYGYHVIMLEDVRPLKAPVFEDMKPQISEGLQQKKVEQHMMELRSKATVK
jgi:peptidyl-prolyl cis-trans isomerase C